MTATAMPRGVIRIPLPDTIQQTEYTCGVASVHALAEYYGVGPRTERECLLDMGVPEAGADPEHIIRGLEKYGLDFKPYYSMLLRQLKASLDRRRPVILMLQAWGTTPDEVPRRRYKQIWSDGHWVVAIGYDSEGVYFEDPSILHSRGFLAYDELEERWHDWGPNYEHMYYYGISVWRSQRSRTGRARKTAHVRTVTRIA